LFGLLFDDELPELMGILRDMLLEVVVMVQAPVVEDEKLRLRLGLPSQEFELRVFEDLVKASFLLASSSATVTSSISMALL